MCTLGTDTVAACTHWSGVVAQLVANSRTTATEASHKSSTVWEHNVIDDDSPEDAVVILAVNRFGFAVHFHLVTTPTCVLSLEQL